MPILILNKIPKLSEFFLCSSFIYFHVLSVQWGQYFYYCQQHELIGKVGHWAAHVLSSVHVHPFTTFISKQNPNRIYLDLKTGKKYIDIVEQGDYKQLVITSTSRCKMQTLSSKPLNYTNNTKSPINAFYGLSLVQMNCNRWELPGRSYLLIDLFQLAFL